MSLPVFANAEDVYGALAKYYDVQGLSLRAATYRLAGFGNNTKYSWDTIMNGLQARDYMHPSDFGHGIMADLAVWLIQQTVLDLLIRPLDDDDRALIEEGLPEPMYPGRGQAQLQVGRVDIQGGVSATHLSHLFAYCHVC